jgi:hypothetical protein
LGQFHFKTSACGDNMAMIGAPTYVPPGVQKIPTCGALFACGNGGFFHPDTLSVLSLSMNAILLNFWMFILNLWDDFDIFWKTSCSILGIFRVMPQCLAAWPEVGVPLRADSHERKRRAAGSAAPVFCYCVLRGTEPSEKCVYIRFLELGTACVPQVHKTWAHWTDKALRLAYICQTQETLSTLRLFSAQKVHIYIYI